MNLLSEEEVILLKRHLKDALDKGHTGFARSIQSELTEHYNTLDKKYRKQEKKYEGAED